MHTSIIRYILLIALLGSFAGCQGGMTAPRWDWWRSAKNDPPKTRSSFASSNPYRDTLPSTQAQHDYAAASSFSPPGGSYPPANTYPSTQGYPAGPGPAGGPSAGYPGSYPVTNGGPAAGGYPAAGTYTADAGNSPGYGAGSGGYDPSNYSGPNNYDGAAQQVGSPYGTAAGANTRYPAAGASSYPNTSYPSTESPATSYPNTNGSYPAAGAGNYRTAPASYDTQGGSPAAGQQDTYPASGGSNGTVETPYEAQPPYGSQAPYGAGGESSLGDRYRSDTNVSDYQPVATGYEPSNTGYEPNTNLGYNEASTAGAAGVQGYAPGSVSHYPTTGDAIAPASYENNGPAARTSEVQDYNDGRYR